jgi:hypothetical protein
MRDSTYEVLILAYQKLILTAADSIIKLLFPVLKLVCTSDTDTYYGEAR